LIERKTKIDKTWIWKSQFRERYVQLSVESL